MSHAPNVRLQDLTGNKHWIVIVDAGQILKRIEEESVAKNRVVL